MSRNDEEKVKGDVGVVCGARKPFGTFIRRGGSGMRNLRDGVPRVNLVHLGIACLLAITKRKTCGRQFAGTR